MVTNRDKIQSLLNELKVEVPDGYYYSSTFGHFQKVNKGIYVYVTPVLFRSWKVQAYIRGSASTCSLEARINWASGESLSNSHEDMVSHYGKNIQKLFNLGEKWLDAYGNNPEGMKDDPYSPWYPNGWAGKDITQFDIDDK